MHEDGGSLPADTGVGRVALRVNDPAAVADFYCEVVGLETGIDDASRDRRVLGVDGDPLLELHADPAAPERPRLATGLFHLAIRVPSRPALGAALARVEDRWSLDGASDHLVSEALYLSDPEDNGVEIYRDRPRSDWPEGPDGRVGMETRVLDLPDLRAAREDGIEGVPAGTDVGHVHLEVSSIAAAREFYVDALGLGVRQTYGDEALFLAAGDYHHHVGVNVWNGRRDRPSGRGLEWFELWLPTDDALAEVGDRLERGGHDPTPIDGGIAVEDPAGIVLRIRSGE